MNGFFHFPKGPKQAIAAHKKGRLKSTAIRVKLVKEKGRSQKKGKRTEGPCWIKSLLSKKKMDAPQDIKKEPKNGMRKGQRIAVRRDKSAVRSMTRTLSRIAGAPCLFPGLTGKRRGHQEGDCPKAPKVLREKRAAGQRPPERPRPFAAVRPAPMKSTDPPVHRAPCQAASEIEGSLAAGPFGMSGTDRGSFPLPSIPFPAP